MLVDTFLLRAFATPLYSPGLFPSMADRVNVAIAWSSDLTAANYGRLINLEMDTLESKASNCAILARLCTAPTIRLRPTFKGKAGIRSVRYPTLHTKFTS